MVQVTQGDCVHDHVFINVRGGGSGGAGGGGTGLPFSGAPDVGGNSSNILTPSHLLEHPSGASWGCGFWSNTTSKPTC